MTILINLLLSDEYSRVFKIFGVNTTLRKASECQCAVDRIFIFSCALNRRDIRVQLSIVIDLDIRQRTQSTLAILFFLPLKLSHPLVDNNKLIGDHL